MNPANTEELVAHGLLVLSIIVFSGVLSSWLGRLIRLPDTLLFIASGVLLGSLGLKLVEIPELSTLNLAVLIFGAAYILYDGGREVELSVLNRIKISLISISTLGVLISAVVTSAFVHWFFKLEWSISFLIGAVLAPTDPSVLVPLFKTIKISPRLKQLIIAESALNDATGSVLALSAKSVILGAGAVSVFAISESLAYEAGLGLAIGVLVGLIYAGIVGHKRFGFFRDYPTQVSLVAVLIGYSVSQYIGASGFMSVFVVGMVCGNMHTMKLEALPSRVQSQTRFKEELTFTLRILIFVLLGSHIDFPSLIQFWPQLALLVLAQIFVVRPISAFLSVGWDISCKWSLKELIYLSWTRETGVIPAALSGFMVAAGVPHANVLSGAVFAVILVTLLVQASTAAPLARFLRLEGSEKSGGSGGGRRRSRGGRRQRPARARTNPANSDL